MAIQHKHTLQVKDLIAALEKLDPNLHIYGYSDDPELVGENEAYKVFSVDSVDANQVERDRDDLTGMPKLKFSDSKESQKVALLNLSYRF
jgi:hypothetical protein